jgi:hypothetical protein
MRWAYCSLLLVLFACKTIETANPKTDELTINDLDIIAPSSIIIPTEIALKSYLNEAEKSLQTKFHGEEKQCEGISYTYDFFREPLDFELKKDEIQYTINGEFALQLSYCPDCHGVFGKEMCVIPRVWASCGIGEPKRRVQLSYSSKIDIDQAFNLQSTTKLKSFKLVDPCQITVFKYNATPTIEKEVRKALVNLEKDIDKQLGSTPIRTTMKEVWRTLQDPVLVAPYGYFYLQPSGIGISDLSLNNADQKAFFTTIIVAQPFFETNKSFKPLLPLPKNNHTTYKQNKSDIRLRTIASYDSINNYLAQNFDTQKIYLTQRKHLDINRIKFIGPQENRMVLEIGFSGTKKGKLYLTVLPYVDASQQLRIKEVEYEVQSKSILLHTAKWLLDDKIKQQIEQEFYYDVGPMLEEVRESVEQSVNTELAPGVFLSGSISNISFDQLFLVSDAVVLDISLSALLQLKVK